MRIHVICTIFDNGLLYLTVHQFTKYNSNTIISDNNWYFIDYYIYSPILEIVLFRACTFNKY